MITITCKDGQIRTVDEYVKYRGELAEEERKRMADEPRYFIVKYLDGRLCVARGYPGYYGRFGSIIVYPLDGGKPFHYSNDMIRDEGVVAGDSISLSTFTAVQTIIGNPNLKAEEKNHFLSLLLGVPSLKEREENRGCDNKTG